MSECPHCHDFLPTVGTTMVLCSCAESRKLEAEQRQQRKMWRAMRTVAMEKQFEIRRMSRRTKTKD